MSLPVVEMLILQKHQSMSTPQLKREKGTIVPYVASRSNCTAMHQVKRIQSLLCTKCTIFPPNFYVNLDETDKLSY